MEIYRTFNGPFPGCPSYEVLQEMYRIALPRLPGDDIAHASLEDLSRRDSKMFFPKSALKDILNMERIRTVLDCRGNCCQHGLESSLSKFETLVESIFKNARILLAVLIYLGSTAWIKTLRYRAIGDDSLDKVIPSITDQCPGGLSPGFVKSYQNALDLFRPPVFVMGEPEFTYQDHQRFPYIEDESFARGSFGEVRKFKIHPDYLDESLAEVATKYTPPSARADNSTDPPAVFARKVLKYTVDRSEFDMEMQVLRIIDQQHHNNIIDLVAFYSWRGELNCVFPFVELNLHNVLHSDWKPESMVTPARFPKHWLWVQITLVTDALRTIHKPPIQSRRDLGTIVGFHFDLKPKNILVTPDGILKITDFGQSMVKMVEDREYAYGTYVGGDAAYAPPEVAPTRSEIKELRATVSSPSPRTSRQLLDRSTTPSTASRKTSTATSHASSLESTRRSSIKSMQIETGDHREPELPAISPTVYAAPSRVGSYDMKLSANSMQGVTREFGELDDTRRKKSLATSVAASSASTEVPKLTVTANYDVWSLACIMTEILVFIFEGGAVGVKDFERLRKEETRDLSFHNGIKDEDCLKSCVKSKFGKFQILDYPDATITPGQSRSYLRDIVDLLEGMLIADPKQRLSSEGVVHDLKMIDFNHQEDNDPDSNIHGLMRELGPIEGFRELGYWRDNGVLPFYNMSDIKLKLDSQTFVDCRLQLFRKHGAIHIRIRHGERFMKDLSHTYLMIFQTVVMRYKPRCGIRVKEVELQAIKKKDNEKYENMYDENTWGRCQIWQKTEPQYVPLQISEVRSTPQRMTGAVNVLLFSHMGFIGIPLQDSKMKIREKLDSFHKASTKVVIEKRDQWCKCFHFMKLNIPGLRSADGKSICPAIPLSSDWLSESKWKGADIIDITFADNTELRSFKAEIKKANADNPQEKNHISWKDASNTAQSNPGISKGYTIK